MNFPNPEPAPAGLLVEVEHPSLGVNVERLSRLLRDVIQDHGFELQYLGVVLTDRESVHTLNREHLNHDFPTDVVSFPMEEDALTRRVVDGEVYIDLDMAAERAPEFGASLLEEVARYAVHGLLHLLGFDDHDEAAQTRIRAEEDRYVARLQPDVFT